jgi:hypothetical protein
MRMAKQHDEMQAVAEALNLFAAAQRARIPIVEDVGTEAA